MAQSNLLSLMEMNPRSYISSSWKLQMTDFESEGLNIKHGDIHRMPVKNDLNRSKLSLNKMLGN